MFAQPQSLLLSTQFHAQDSLHLGQHLIVRNPLALLVLLHNTLLLVDSLHKKATVVNHTWYQLVLLFCVHSGTYSRKFLLRHVLGVPCLLDCACHIDAHRGVLQLVELAVQRCGVLLNLVLTVTACCDCNQKTQLSS